jgi:hypothetical protein
MKPPKTLYIYGLKDPRDGLIHYVGQTKRPERRLSEHLWLDRGRGHKGKWIAELKVQGIRPEMIILSQVTRSEIDEEECLWIAKGRELGWPLTNVADRQYGHGGGVPFAWFKPYLSSELWAAFAGLKIADRWRICQATAHAMIPFCGLRRRQSGLPYDGNLEFEAGRQTANTLVAAASD